MSKEREMIEKLCSFQMPYSDWLLLIAEAEELLAQPEQEPVAWMNDSGGCFLSDGNKYSENWTALYTEPPKQPESTAEAVMPKSVMSEQQPEAWIIVNKETGYRTQVSDLTPFLYHREIFEVIPLYTAPPVKSEQEHVGIVRTIGGYPDDSEHVVDWVCKYRELKQGDRLYLAPPKREPLINIYVLNAFKADDEATHPYSYWAGVEFAEKHHGIGVEL